MSGTSRAASADKHFYDGKTFGLAIGLEIALLGLAAAWVMLHAQAEPAPPPIPIELTQAPDAPKPPEPPKPQPKPHVAPQKIVPPQPQPPQPVPLPTPNPAPSPFVAPVTPPPPPPAPSGKSDAHLQYSGQVRAAVQAATVYPPAAQALKFSGRTRVSFLLRDGVASQARVVTSCGVGLIDRAALQAVQNAAYPPPPAELRGKDDLYEVWVEFSLR